MDTITEKSVYASKATGKKWEVDTVMKTGHIILVAEDDRGWACDTRIIRPVTLKRFYDLIHEE